VMVLAAVILLAVVAGVAGAVALLPGDEEGSTEGPAMVAAAGPKADPAGAAEEDGEADGPEITFDPEALWDAKRAAPKARRSKPKVADAFKTAKAPLFKEPTTKRGQDDGSGRLAGLPTRRPSSAGLDGNPGRLKGLSALDRLDAARGGGVDKGRLALLGKEAGTAHLPAGLTPEQIKKVIHRHRLGLKSCLERHMKREGSDSVESRKVVISFKIRTSGRPSRIRLSDGMGDSTFGMCVSKQISNWSFPRFRGEPVPVNYPVILTASH